MAGQEGADNFTIAMHPIHDADYSHVADRLVYQQHDSDHDDPVSNTARALSAALYEIDDGQRLASRELFIELPSEWLVRQDLLPTPAARVVICLPPSLEITPEVADSLRRIRERRYRIAAPDTIDGVLDADGESIADIIEIDASRPLDVERLQSLKVRGFRLLAEHVQDHEQLEQCLAGGCDYVNGRYLSRPHYHVSKPRGRHGNRAAQLRLINELYRDDVDLARLHDLLLQMPHLHVAILRRANSSYFGQRQQQSDLRRAIQVIGLNELRRLVMTMSLASYMPSSRITLRMALIRAFMCQNLAEPFRTIDPEEAFTTGLFSMMSALLDEDQEALLAELPLAERILQALEQHEGHLGAILAICEEYEQQLAENTSEHSVQRLQACYIDALEKTDILMGRF